MKTAKVTVTDYDPSWPTAFEKIRKPLADLLGPLAVRIEHVGSTSVPGLAAKPIIDLDVVIANASDFPAVCGKLGSIGYIHEGNLGIEGREAFRYESKPGLMKHHLYVCPADSPELHRHLTFRDYLRSHPPAAAEYGTVKLEAARKFPHSIDDYIQYKSSCIERLYSQCGL